MRSRVSISSQQILRDIYTPGTARVCLAIRAAPENAFDFTYLGRTVGIVTAKVANPQPDPIYGLGRDIPHV